MSNIKRLALLIVLSITVTGKPGLSIAQQTLVRSYENPSLSIGQAYLTRYGDECIALLPWHVAAESKIPAFLSEGNALLGEAEQVSDIGDDIAVAQVTGNITRDCGISMSTISRAVDALLRSQGLASLRSVNSDGTLANISVTVVDNDGEKYLRVRPTNDRIQIRKGHSGSLLMLGGKPVGMLLSINARHGVGKVLRFDKLLAHTESHMASRVQAGSTGADKPTTEKAGLDLAAASQGGSIAGWNSLPIDMDHRPANLIANESAPPWRANVDHWPAEIELDLAGDKVIISRIELDGRDIPSTDELPGRVEIFVNISSSERRWRSLLSRIAEFDSKGIAVFPIAPTWARQVKISISNSRGASNATSLRRIHISNP